jgi:7-cyano-7-deazaguanine synthase
MKKVVMGLSGGMDSATLLGLLLNEGAEVHACHFQYGSKHNAYEQKAVYNIVRHYLKQKMPLTLYPFPLEDVFRRFQSNLLQSGGEIPEGHYESESMKLTVVPGRNLIFASIMAGLAESIGADAIALGVHSGDHHIYPDCRGSFITSLRQTIRESTNSTVQTIAPLLADDKTSILRKGIPLLVPYHLTRTCYKDQELSCGKCGSCVERLEAFESINITDPIKYE